MVWRCVRRCTDARSTSLAREHITSMSLAERVARASHLCHTSFSSSESASNAAPGHAKLSGDARMRGERGWLVAARTRNEGARRQTAARRQTLVAEGCGTAIFRDTDDVVPNVGKNSANKRPIVVPLRANSKDAMLLQARPVTRAKSHQASHQEQPPRGCTIWSAGQHTWSLLRRKICLFGAAGCTPCVLWIS